MPYDFKKLLSEKFGFKADQLAKLEVDGITADDEKKVAGELLDAYHASLETNKEFQEKFIKPAEKKALDNTRGEYKRKLISTLALEVSEEDQKDFDKVLEAAKKKQGEGASANVKDLQLELDKSKGELKLQKETFDKQLGEKDKELATRELTSAFRTTLVTEMPLLESDGKKLTGTQKVNLPFFQNELSSKYSIIKVGDAIDIRDKENPDKPVYDGAKKLTLKDAMLKIASENEMLAAPGKQKAEGGKEKVEGGKTEEGKFTSEGLKSAQQNLEKLEAAEK